MKIAVDKKTFNIPKKEGVDYIYIFKDEPLDELFKTGLWCLRYDMCEYVDINLTEYEIDCLKKAKITDADFDKMPEIINFKIGIIIPNYNYEHTINKCLQSILNQNYKNYEVIFVDDMSTDDSVKIAAKYKNMMNIKIVELKQKRLNGGARNEGYLHLSKDVNYIWYVDSDDWINENALYDINIKLQTKPDVLFVAMDDYKNGKQKLVFTPKYKDKYEAIQGWSGSSGKVIKKSLATRQECLYNEGTLKEDRNQHYKICFYMKSFELLKKPVYVWNKTNTKSVTTIRDEATWGTSTIRHYADAKQFYLTIKGQDKKIDRIMQRRLNICKNEILSGGDKQW